MMKKGKGRLFFKSRLIGRGKGNQIFFSGILDQLGFWDVHQVEELVKAIEHTDRLLACIRAEAKSFFSEANVARLYTVDGEVVLSELSREPGHFGAVFFGFFRDKNSHASLVR